MIELRFDKTVFFPNVNEMESRIFKGKKAFITGSSRGIGRAIAVELARLGADILIHFNKNEDAAQSVQNELQDLGVKTWLYQANFCETEQTEALLTRVTKEHDHLDIFVANAASTAFKPIADLNVANIAKTMNLVIASFVLCVQKLKPLMAGRDAQILTISGIDTTNFCPGHGLLAAAKAALETLTKYLAVELSPDKIHAKCLNPGLVASDSTKFYLGGAFQEICDAANQIAPQKGFATPEEVAKLASLLLRPEMDWIATQTVYANGGLNFMLPGFLK